MRVVWCGCSLCMSLLFQDWLHDAAVLWIFRHLLTVKIGVLVLVPPVPGGLCDRLRFRQVRTTSDLCVRLVETKALYKICGRSTLTSIPIYTSSRRNVRHMKMHVDATFHSGHFKRSWWTGANMSRMWPGRHLAQWIQSTGNMSLGTFQARSIAIFVDRADAGASLNKYRYYIWHAMLKQTKTWTPDQLIFLVHSAQIEFYVDCAIFCNMFAQFFPGRSNRLHRCPFPIGWLINGEVCLPL